MNSTQIADAIKILVISRDNDGADVQPVIDALFAQWEEMNAVGLARPHPDHIAHSEAIARMG